MERAPVNVLIVEDSHAEAQLVLDALAFARAPGFRARHTTRLSHALVELDREPVDVVLLDLGLPDASGLDAVAAIRSAAPDAAIVVRSGIADEEVALAALEAGAQDYLLKGVRGMEQSLERSILFALVRRQAEDSARMLAAIVTASEDAILGKSTAGVILSFNAGAERMYGYPAEEAIGQPIALLVPDDRRGEENRILQRVLAGDQVSHFETQRRRKDGTVIDVSLSISPLTDVTGTIIGAATIAREITQRKQLERAHRESELRFAAAFEQAPIGVAIVGIRGRDRGRFIKANSALTEMTGRAVGELDGVAIDTIVHPDDLSLTVGLYEKLDLGQSSQVDQRYLHRDGRAVWVLTSCTPVGDETGQGPAYGVMQVLDISERKRFEGQLLYLADHDALTGLYNRHRFESELERLLNESRRYGRPGALLVLDLDGFKFVNDRFGHPVGDELVTKVAGLLRQSVRDTDVLARLGGDEFAAILQECSQAQAVAIAEKILETIRRRGIVVSKRGQARVTTSIGIATFDGEGALTGPELVVEADIAMYDAKSEGRDRYSTYDRASNPRAVLSRRHSWLDRLRSAIDDDLFELHAQPIVGICANGIPHFELLLRMRDDLGDLMAPGAFLYNAERFDLMGDIDRWVLFRAIELLRRYTELGHDLSLSVNLSGRTMNDLRLPTDLAAMLATHPIPRERLIVEVTETAAIVNIERARDLARELRRLGCLFALDDFGAGFASFYYLKHLEFDYLKIDGEFITKLVDTPSDQLVVRAVVDIARGLGTKTVAEFVGDDRTTELLRTFGVDYGQGHHLGRPGPIHEQLPSLVGATAS
jgi:diguanylate cyclase (GGDEF)-like protein/PAS domain S-box-containing protein